MQVLECTPNAGLAIPLRLLLLLLLLQDVMALQDSSQQGKGQHSSSRNLR